MHCTDARAVQMASGGGSELQSFLGDNPRDAAFTWGEETVLQSVQVRSGGLESSFGSWAKEEEKHRCSSYIQLRKAQQRSSLWLSRGGFPEEKQHFSPSFSLFQHSLLPREIHRGAGNPETARGCSNLWQGGTAGTQDPWSLSVIQNAAAGVSPLRCARG